MISSNARPHHLDYAVELSRASIAFARELREHSLNSTVCPCLW